MNDRRSIGGPFPDRLATSLPRSLAVVLAATTLLAGCSRQVEPTSEASTPPPVAQTTPEATSPPTLPPETAVAFGQAAVRFEMPTTGMVIPGPVGVCLAAEALRLAPVGEARPGEGHFVVLVNPAQEELLAIGAGAAAALPSDEKHVHLDDGASCLTLDLAPGEHTLVAVVADGAEVPLSPPVMDMVVVTVAGPPPEPTAASEPVAPAEGTLSPAAATPAAPATP